LAAKTLRAACLLALDFVVADVTARCGEVPSAPPRPKPKSPAAAPFPVFKQALSQWLAPASFALWLVATSFPASAQIPDVPADGNRRPEPERFLFIIDVGSDMQKRATNTQRAVHQLFATGFQGQLRPGDTIGMWTYNNELHTGQYPLQRWLPRVSREISVASIQFVQDLRYGKRSQLETLRTPLADVVADSDRITVVLISDGEEATLGTPFDGRIAEVFKLNAAEQRRRAMPFVTILRAAQGSYVGVKVNTPPWPIEFPAYPNDVRSNQSSPTNPPPPKIETPPLPPTVTPAAVTEPKPVTPETNQPALVVTNPPVVVTPPPPVEIPTNPAPAATKSMPPASTNLARTATVATNPTPTSPAAPASDPTNSVRETRVALIPILAGAGIVLLGLAILSLALLRRSRTTPRVSLITRSMNKPRK